MVVIRKTEDLVKTIRVLNEWIFKLESSNVSIVADSWRSVKIKGVKPENLKYPTGYYYKEGRITNKGNTSSKSFQAYDVVTK